MSFLRWLRIRWCELPCRGRAQWALAITPECWLFMTATRPASGTTRLGPRLVDAGQESSSLTLFWGTSFRKGQQPVEGKGVGGLDQVGVEPCFFSPPTVL